MLFDWWNRAAVSLCMHLVDFALVLLRPFFNEADPAQQWDCGWRAFPIPIIWRCFCSILFPSFLFGMCSSWWQIRVLAADACDAICFWFHLTLIDALVDRALPFYITLLPIPMSSRMAPYKKAALNSMWLVLYFPVKCTQQCTAIHIVCFIWYAWHRCVQLIVLLLPCLWRD